MFIGHFGLGFGAKKAAPAVSLGALFLACQFADLLWPTLVLLGVERLAIEPGATVVTPLAFISYPYSHSLLALCGWTIIGFRVCRIAVLGCAPCDHFQCSSHHLPRPACSRSSRRSRSGPRSSPRS